MTSKKAIKLLKRYGNDQENVMELYKVIEDEIADLKHNYKVINEMYNNSVAYGTKIQAELNGLKRQLPNLIATAIQCGYGVEHASNVELQEQQILNELISKAGNEEWM